MGFRRVFCAPRAGADASFEQVGRHTVTYPDVDMNLHMNNTKYADMLCSFVPEFTAAVGRGSALGAHAAAFTPSPAVREFSITYLADAPLGGTLTVLRSGADGTYFFRTVREDGKVNVEARIALG